MKILLLNNNPVVSKLVTLSAQKTSDELEIVGTVDAIKNKAYDLLVVDDTLYSDALFEELQNSVDFHKSLYICARDAKQVDGFTSVLKKPFLPTDLVDIFASIAKDVKNDDLEIAFPVEPLEDEIDLNIDTSLDEEKGLDDLEDLGDLGNLEDLDNLEDLGDLGDLNEIEDIMLSDASLDDELLLLDDDNDEEDDDNDEDVASLGDSVLDKDELQEVQELLEDAEEDSDDLDDLDDLDFDHELSIDDSELQDLENESPVASDKTANLDFLDAFDDDETEEEEMNLESQIEEAVDALTEEDLASELSQEMLLDITADEIGVKNEIDAIDLLSSRDLKLAIGEDLGEDESDVTQQSKEVDTAQDVHEPLQSNLEITPDNKGVEALKKLLQALSNEDVAASLKGMKININISLGDIE